MTKIMILNGPPRCGKDTAAKAIEDYFGENVCKHVKFSTPLKLIASNVAGLSVQELEASKEAFREEQINTFKQLVPVYGDHWLGSWLLNDIKKYEQSCFVVSDGGRTADIMPLLREYSPKNLLIVQIMREGCTFKNDIRSYITAYSVRIRPAVNKDLEVFKAELIDFAGEFFGDE